MKTRIVKIGNSLGVILPKKVVKELYLKKGDSFTLRTAPQNKTLILSKGRQIYVDEDFVSRVSAFSKKYEKDLKRLAE